MKKIAKGITFVLLAIVIFSFAMFEVNAKTLDSILQINEVSNNCENIIGSVDNKESVAYLLQEIFNVMKFATPLLVLIFSIIDFIKAVSSQDKDQLQKATKRTIIRVIVGLAIFVVPAMFDFVFTLIGWNGTCGIK